MTIRFSLSAVAPMLLAAFLAAGPSQAVAQPPPNDNFDSATAVTEPLPFSDNVSTVEGTTAPDDPFVFGQGPTVWYGYTPSADGFIAANTFGSNYDTTLGAFTGTRGDLTLIAANDDSGSLQSRIVLPVTAGTTYYFMVGSFASGPGGDLVFTVDVSPPPAVVDLNVAPVVPVDPKTGTATVRVGIESSAPIFLFGFDIFLKQRTGRGNVVGGTFLNVFETVESFQSSAVVTDAFGGKGFVGGRANLSVAAIYIDLVTGEFQFQVFEAEVQMRAGRR